MKFPARSQRPGPGRWRRRGPVLALACLVLATGALASQPIRFDRVSLDEGLSQATVYSVLQDSLGYIWLGTEDGLNRYDGRTITVFSHDPTDRSSLPSDVIRAIVEDRAGDLWVGTDDGGVARLDRASGRFERLVDVASSRPASPRVRALRFDAAGRLWIGTLGAGLERFDPATRDLVHFGNDPSDPTSLAHDNVLVLHADRRGGLWVGTDAGLDRFDPEGESFAHLGRSAGLADDRIRSIHDDADGALWVGTRSGGLHRVDAERGIVQAFRHDPSDPASLADDRVSAVLSDGAGRLWVGTRAGLHLFDADTGSFHRYAHDPAEPGSLSDDNVLAIADDRTGLIWIGTRFGGVNALNPLSWQFGHRAAVSADAPSKAARPVTAFTEAADGAMWVGTYGGGVRRVDSAGEVSVFRHDASAAAGLPSDRVMALAAADRGDVWVGTLDAGLTRFDARTGRFEPVPGLPVSGVMALEFDRRRTLWVGTFGGGLAGVDVDSGAVRVFRHDPADPAGLGSDRVTSLEPAAGGLLWVGTDGGGLHLFDPNSGVVRRFVRREGDAGSLPSDVVYSIFAGPRDTLWVGTRDGLVRISDAADSGRDATFRTYLRRDGLPNDVIYGIEPDRAGNLWLSTNNGLSRFDPRRETFLNYDVADGLQSNEFNFGAAFRSRSGELYFGGVNGYNAFVPERLQRNEHAPAVVVTAVERARRAATELGPADQVRTVDLPSDNNVVGFEFAALDFVAPERQRFLYRLDGFDPDWVDSGNARRAVYTNLDPGRYVFRVRAANADGVWSTEDASIEVQVEREPLLAAVFARARIGLMLVGMSLLGSLGATWRRRVGC